MVGTAPMVALRACIELKAALHSSVSYKPSRMAWGGHAQRGGGAAKPLPTGVPVPLQMHIILCTMVSACCSTVSSLFQHYFFLCTAAILIFFFYYHRKKNNLIFLLLFFSSRGEQMNGTAVTAPQQILAWVLQVSMQQSTRLVVAGSSEESFFRRRCSSRHRLVLCPPWVYLKAHVPSVQCQGIIETRPIYMAFL